jgi:uncharacterized protein (TIGR02118 family)
MIRFSVFYPQSEGATFDHEYYRAKHVPLCRDSWNPTGAEIDRGLDGPHVAAVHFLFDSNEDLQAALASEGTSAIMADVANYTTIVPVTQVSETF